MRIALALALVYGTPPSEPNTARVNDGVIEAIEFPAPVRTYGFETYGDDPIGVRQFVLSNGLRVMLSENHERPEVFGAVVVRTGGKNDPADNTGMAHYLEHMLFKGTQSLGTSDWEAERPLQEKLVELYEQHAVAQTPSERSDLQKQISETIEKTYAFAIPNELDRILSEMGGTGVNAFTTEDETVYHNTFPASQIVKWLDVYAHRFEAPVFRLFPTELEAVYEEKNISLDRFEVKLFETFTREAFPQHPYGTQTVLGEVEHLKRPSLVAMREYFERYYVPNNMALVLSGDFDSDEVMPLIEARFGRWERGEDPKARSGVVEPFEGRELIKLRVSPLRVGAFGFRTPTPRHPDYPALLVMRELLYNEQGSGFIDRLVDEGRLLIAFPLALDQADHGLDIFFFAPRIFSQSFRAAERNVREQFAKVARGEFDDETMLVIRDNLRRAEDRQWEHNEDRALAMAGSFIRHDGWQGYLDYRKGLATVTREDVMRVANDYFGADHLAMRSRMGFPKKTRLEAPHFPPVKPQPGAQSKAYQALSGVPTPAPVLRFVDFDADVDRVEVRPGVELQRVVNPFNDTYTLELRFGAGYDAIRELHVVPDYLSKLGTHSRSPAQFKQALFRIGTTLSIDAEVDQLTLTLEGPEAHLHEALSLANELLTQARSDSRRFRALRRERRGYEKVARRDPDERSAALRSFAIYGDKSEYLTDYGTKGLRKLSPEMVMEAWREVQGYAVQVRYAGMNEASEVAQELLRTIEFAEALQPPLPRVVYPKAAPSENTIYFLPKRDAVQSRLHFFVNSGPVAPEDRATADAYDHYLGGSMAGLIFQEIREFRALAYSAWGGFRRDPLPDQPGYFVGQIGCQGDKTEEVLEVMMGLIEKMPQKREQMPALKAALIRMQESSSPGFRELLGQIDQWVRRGYDRDPRQALIPAYGELEYEDIQSFYERYVQGRPITLTIVGDPRRFDLARLSQLGRVVEVKDRDIYSP